jgi:hypothetical protein
MKNLEYLELTPISNELIVDIYQTIRNTTPKERHSVPEGTDAEKYSAWNSIKASNKLKEFTKTIFDFEHDVHIFVLAGDLPVHKDNTRDVAYNYVLETGGATTNFHNEEKVLIEQHNIETFRWHQLNVKNYHSVLIPEPPRIVVSVSVYWPKDSSK